MSKKIRAFIGYLKVLVNGETLGGGFYRFLSVHACFLVFYGLPRLGVLINPFPAGRTRNFSPKEAEKRKSARRPCCWRQGFCSARIPA